VTYVPIIFEFLKGYKHWNWCYIWSHPLVLFKRFNGNVQLLFLQIASLIISFLYESSSVQFRWYQDDLGNINYEEMWIS
jgi:hypothetical protein